MTAHAMTHRVMSHFVHISVTSSSWTRPSLLNHGSFGATPKSVLEAQTYWRGELERNPVAFIVDRLPTLQRAAAERLGHFLGTSGDCIGFVENATTAVNAVIRSLDLGPGDEIITPKPRVRRRAQRLAVCLSSHRGPVAGPGSTVSHRG